MGSERDDWYCPSKTPHSLLPPHFFVEFVDFLPYNSVKSVGLKAPPYRLNYLTPVSSAKAWGAGG